MFDLIKVVAKTVGGSLVSILLGAAAMKIIAVILGPSGVGLFSLLRQMHQTAVTIGTLGGGTALVQGLTSREGEAKQNYLRAVFWAFMFGAVFTIIGLISMASEIAIWVFGQNDMNTIKLVRWMTLPTFLGVVLAFLNSVLNGFRAIGQLAWIQVQGAAVTVVLAYPVARLAATGYPVAFVMMLSLALMGGIIHSSLTAYRAGWLQPLFKQFRSHFKFEPIKHFISIAGTTLITGFMGTGMLLLVRAIILNKKGLAEVGFFDVAWTLSMMYVMIILTSFSTYYLPALSGITSSQQRVNLMHKLVRFVILLMVPLVTLMVSLKPFVIQILYSSDFFSSLKLIRWMLIGDYFKVISWVFAMPMIASVDMRRFFLSELFWSIGFLGFSVLSVCGFESIQGIGVGFIFLYIVYFIYVLNYSYKKYQLTFVKDTIVLCLLGMSIVVGASVSTWSDVDVNWIVAALWISLAIAFSWFSLFKEERLQLYQVFLLKGGSLFRISH